MKHVLRSVRMSKENGSNDNETIYQASCVNKISILQDLSVMYSVEVYSEKATSMSSSKIIIISQLNGER